MNAFLVSLVARTEGRLPVLERRPRSLFEPVAGAVAPRVTPQETRAETEPSASNARIDQPQAHAARTSAVGWDAAASSTPTATRSVASASVELEYAQHREAPEPAGTLVVPAHHPRLAPQSPSREDERPSTARAPKKVAELDGKRAARGPAARDQSQPSPHAPVAIKSIVEHTSRVAQHASQPTPRANGTLEPRSPRAAPASVLLAKANTGLALRREAATTAAPSSSPV